MLTVGKLINTLEKFDEDTLIDVSYSKELAEVLSDMCDGMYLRLLPKLKVFHCSDNDKEKINFVVDYYCPDGLSDEELEEIEGPLDELHVSLKKEINID